MTLVRPERPEDVDAIRAVTERAFGANGHHGVGDLVDTLRADAAKASLVATDGDAVIGHVMLSRGWIDAERITETLILSPLSVDPPHQGRGVGGTLVRAAIAAANSLGAPALFLEGSPVYYSRFGFGPGHEAGFASPSVHIPAPGFQVVLLDAHDPSVTGALVYPDAFWRHDAVGLRGPR